MRYERNLRNTRDEFKRKYWQDLRFESCWGVSWTFEVNNIFFFNHLLLFSHFVDNCGNHSNSLHSLNSKVRMGNFFLIFFRLLAVLDSFLGCWAGKFKYIVLWSINFSILADKYTWQFIHLLNNISFFLFFCAIFSWL